MPTRINIATRNHMAAMIGIDIRIMSQSISDRSDALVIHDDVAMPRPFELVGFEVEAAHDFRVALLARADEGIRGAERH